MIPELKLWQEVLRMAVRDLADKQNADKAKHWLFRSKRRDIGSFLWICEIFNLDPFAARKRIMEYTACSGKKKEAVHVY